MDDGADGIVETIWICEYDGERLTRAGADEGTDGSIDAWILYTYDADGNLLVEEHDLGADGVIDSRTTNTYTAQGDLFTHEREQGRP